MTNSTISKQLIRILQRSDSSRSIKRAIKRRYNSTKKKDFERTSRFLKKRNINTTISNVRDLQHPQIYSIPCTYMRQGVYKPERRTPSALEKKEGSERRGRFLKKRNINTTISNVRDLQHPQIYSIPCTYMRQGVYKPERRTPSALE
ncbi:hypothetical protein NQ315_005799 [Exocentrus adspersus]|uniref:Uncharacterized protein n=1 Tax=Exocentrus adspersus TaxID=1586481 RepID=A0AAV8VRD6_9CUCU|nr:hypothetical protein NQ315_005799 [Exocentrus adspersus]